MGYYAGNAGMIALASGVVRTGGGGGGGNDKDPVTFGIKLALIVCLIAFVIKSFMKYSGL